jgi:hypothetical protein
MYLLYFLSGSMIVRFYGIPPPPYPSSTQKSTKTIPCRPARSILCNIIAHSLFIYHFEITSPSPPFCLPYLSLYCSINDQPPAPHFNEHFTSNYILASSTDINCCASVANNGAIDFLLLFFKPQHFYPSALTVPDVILISLPPLSPFMCYVRIVKASPHLCFFCISTSGPPPNFFPSFLAYISRVSIHPGPVHLPPLLVSMRDNC